MYFNFFKSIFKKFKIQLNEFKTRPIRDIRGPLKPKKPGRKAKIVAAAIDCFSKAGVAQTKMSDVAEKAGVDQPLIHYYFPSLESLYIDVVNEVLEHLKEFMLARISKESTDPQAVLCASISSYFEWGKKFPGYGSLWMYFYYLTTYNKTFSNLNRLIRENGRSRIASIVYQGIEKGKFKIPQGWTVDEVALSLQSMITGHTITAFTEGTDNWRAFSEIAVKSGLQLVGVSTTS